MDRFVLLVCFVCLFVVCFPFFGGGGGGQEGSEEGIVKPGYAAKTPVNQPPLHCIYFTRQTEKKGKGNLKKATRSTLNVSGSSLALSRLC